MQYIQNRQKDTHAELYSKCIQLKLKSADGKRYATDCFAQEDIAAVVKTLSSKNITAFIDWFTFSDNSIDGQSRKKAYTLYESGIEAAELFAAARENAQWRYRSYLRMLSTNWDKE